jgi:hypothetical protein
MSFLVKEYNIPLLGEVRIIEGTRYDKREGGKYYAESEHWDEDNICSDSLEELNEMLLNQIKFCYNEKREERVKEKISLEKKIKELIGHINDLEEIEDKNEWLNHYHTNNPLELDNQ